jgi:hypothetical protein
MIDGPVNPFDAPVAGAAGKRQIVRPQRLDSDDEAPPRRRNLSKVCYIVCQCTSLCAGDDGGVTDMAEGSEVLTDCWGDRKVGLASRAAAVDALHQKVPLYIIRAAAGCDAGLGGGCEWADRPEVRRA